MTPTRLELVPALSYGLESLRADVAALALGVADPVFSARPHLLDLLGTEALEVLRARFLAEYLGI